MLLIIVSFEQALVGYGIFQHMEGLVLNNVEISVENLDM